MKSIEQIISENENLTGKEILEIFKKQENETKESIKEKEIQKLDEEIDEITKGENEIYVKTTYNNYFMIYKFSGFYVDAMFDPKIVCDVEEICFRTLNIEDDTNEDIITHKVFEHSVFEDEDYQIYHKQPNHIPSTAEEFQCFLSKLDSVESEFKNIFNN